MAKPGTGQRCPTNGVAAGVGRSRTVVLQPHPRHNRSAACGIVVTRLTSRVATGNHTAATNVLANPYVGSVL